MKLIFSPEYSGQVYTGLSKDTPCLMDIEVVNTIGLVSHLELPLGLFYGEMPDHRRNAIYYNALKKYMKSHPDNQLSKSFKLSGLSTATQVLKWRDALMTDNWDAEKGAVSPRLEIIKAIEPTIQLTSIGERIKILTDKISSDKSISYKGYEVEIPCDIELMHPSVSGLLRLLESRGAQLSIIVKNNGKKTNLDKVRELLLSDSTQKIKLDPKDSSFQIYQFLNEKEAEEYMAFKGDDLQADVWINNANKSHDNWLRAMGKPTMGSSMADSVPQIVQLFVLAIGLFEQPLNVSMLIDWLYAPVHPLAKYFRKCLAEAIINQGGYRNDKCRQMIADYIDGKYEYHDPEEDLFEDLSEEERKKAEKDEKKKKKKREENVRLFLPSIEDPTSNDINADEIREVIAELGSWAMRRMHMMIENKENDLWINQLNTLAGMCETLSLLLSDEKGTINRKLIDSWISTLYKGAQYGQYVPQVGCRFLVDNPSKLVAISKCTVWMNVDGDESSSRDLDFLLPSEQEKISKAVTQWDIEKENRYHHEMMLTPFFRTRDKLILTSCEYRGSELTQIHPIMVRLMNQVENLASFILHPSLDKEQREEVVRTHNENLLTEQNCNFNRTGLLQWPDHTSPTSIGKLIQSPFDYVMSDLLSLANYGPGELGDIKTTKGNVAHAVIQALFAPRADEKVSVASQIQSRIATEYDDTFKKIVDGKGAILNLPENKLECKLLHEQLREQLDILVEIIGDNNLKVKACEYRMLQKIGLLPNEDPERGDLKGFIDMTLEDENGHPVVFDFKWTSSRHYYQDLLRTNRSIQLEMYRWMLSKDSKDTVERTAYFLMPEGTLYSKEEFIGKHCKQLIPENNKNIVAQLMNSFKYRKEQIEAGVIEIAEGVPVADIQYTKDAEKLDLYPLDADDEEMKPVNIFSNYSLLKGQL